MYGLRLGKSMASKADAGYFTPKLAQPNLSNTQGQHFYQKNIPCAKQLAMIAKTRLFINQLNFPLSSAIE